MPSIKWEIGDDWIYDEHDGLTMYRPRVAPIKRGISAKVLVGDKWIEGIYGRSNYGKIDLYPAQDHRLIDAQGKGITWEDIRGWKADQMTMGGLLPVLQLGFLD